MLPIAENRSSQFKNYWFFEAKWNYQTQKLASMGIDPDLLHEPNTQGRRHYPLPQKLPELLVVSEVSSSHYSTHLVRNVSGTTKSGIRPQ